MSTGLGLRAREADSDARPSPLKYLTFWRVVLDEVQKAPTTHAAGGTVHVQDASMTCPRHVPQAPTSYAAGRTVRLVRAVHRWAVSGTPMEAGRLADIRHLINFVAGEASQLEAVWRRAAEGGRLGEIWPS